MNQVARAMICMLLAAATVWAQPKEGPPALALFEIPKRVKAGDSVVTTESPGYASPCWADTDGDGRADLVVGQFTDGKMKVYRNLGDGKFAAGEWIRTADGEIAEVPGVW